jgi:hypothetical protein
MQGNVIKKSQGTQNHQVELILRDSLSCTKNSILMHGTPIATVMYGEIFFYYVYAAWIE